MMVTLIHQSSQLYIAINQKPTFFVETRQRGGWHVLLSIGSFEGVLSIKAWSPCRVVSSNMKLYFTLSLSTQVYKMSNSASLGTLNDGLASHPGGSSNTPSHFMLDIL